MQINQPPTFCSFLKMMCYLQKGLSRELEIRFTIFITMPTTDAILMSCMSAANGPQITTSTERLVHISHSKKRQWNLSEDTTVNLSFHAFISVEISHPLSFKALVMYGLHRYFEPRVLILSANAVRNDYYKR